jgi:hypothetical protein
MELTFRRTIEANIKLLHTIIDERHLVVGHQPMRSWRGENESDVDE